MTDARLQALGRWLTEELGVHADSVVAVSSDASFRRYFRVRESAASFIVMDAPPDKEDTATFVKVAQLFAAREVNVPRILAHDAAQGFILLGDLGDTQYLGVLKAENADRLYGAAFAALLRLQGGAPRDESVLPLYSRARLQTEMDLFADWYVARELGVTLSAAQREILHQACEHLLASAAEQPRVWVHRDYHSRNLMLTAERNPGILDFQDAVIGPLTYDLVSLLRDSYIAWPAERVRAWVLDYLHRAMADGLCPRTDDATLWRWFEWMGVQRQLKVVGIFTRLAIRDHKPGYRRDIPRTLNYLLQAARAYPELKPLHDMIVELGENARSGATS